MVQTRVVKIGRIPVRYAVAGSGAPLVLIHGLAASWTWWRRNLPALEKYHTVYLLDLPGFGSMRAHRREFALDRAPEWVRGVLSEIGLSRPSVIGHSMGGAIAVSLAARWPDEVDRLVLVAPALNLPYRTMFEGMRPLLAATHRMPLRFLPTLAYDALRAGPRTIVRASRSLFAIEEGQRFDSIRCPTLLIWGDRDTLVPLALADRLLALLPGSQLCVIKRAGHVVMFDRASEFNNAVLQFLASGAVGG